MAKPRDIELATGERMTILYEDRSVLALDKPVGWMLVPFSWQDTARNLQAALISSIQSGAFWAKSRQLRFLRYVHRLDADTTGVLLFAKSQGAVESYGRLFEGRAMRKRYLAVIEGAPTRTAWASTGRIGPDPDKHGCMRIDPREGKEAETHFKVLQTVGGRTLLEARPVTGRTHQIRVHLKAENLRLVGDVLYGSGPARHGMALRSVELAYADPFTRKEVVIRAPIEEFLERHGFALERSGAGSRPVEGGGIRPAPDRP
jgi:23S rRNA pseudouridine1911/1915/1917 synthase